MATIHRLFIEADLLKRKLEAALVHSYRYRGDNWYTKKICRYLDRAERRKARRQRALRLDTINRATSGRKDSFREMMESYMEGAKI